MHTLNKNQMAAAAHCDGPMMVLAGPGSGKTTVILHRILTLINKHGADPREILAVTFTKAAAEEMRVRFNEFNTGAAAVFSTFHSLFYRVVSAHYGYTTANVLQEAERTGILKSLLYELGLAADEEFAKEISSELSLIKNELIEIEHYNSQSIGSDDFKNVYNAYETYKQKNKKIDFDDMTVACLGLFTNNQAALARWKGAYKYILIDEFQDINKAQYECIKMMDGSNNLFVVGDDDQSIYRFRGARPEFLLNFPKEHPGVKQITLGTNYRSTDKIINLCNKVIAANQTRYEKELAGTGRAGPSPAVIRPQDIAGEANAVAERVMTLSKKIPYNEMAVIYRVNIQSRAYIDIFMNLNIPFVIKDEAPGIYEHWTLKDILSYLRLSVNKESNEDATRIINKPKRYITKDAVSAAVKKPGSVLTNILRAPNMEVWQRARVEELLFYLDAIKKRAPYDAFRYIREAADYDGYIREYASYRRIKPDGLYEILDELMEGAKSFQSIPEYIGFIEKAAAASKDVRIKKKEAADGITLSTMHSAKGLEFEAVFLIGAVEGLIPHEKSVSEAEIEEERRLFYVGLTRAKSVLYISLLKTRREQTAEPSSFLDGIIKKDGGASGKNTRHH